MSCNPRLLNWPRGCFFENAGPNWVLGLGKFKPHDFRAKNTRTNRIKQKIQFGKEIARDYVSTYTIMIFDILTT